MPQAAAFHLPRDAENAEWSGRRCSGARESYEVWKSPHMVRNLSSHTIGYGAAWAEAAWQGSCSKLREGEWLICEAVSYRA